MIGTVLSHGKATMAELTTVLSVEDVHDLYELIMVDNWNRRIMKEWADKGRR